MRTKNLENSLKRKKAVLIAAAKCFTAKGFHQTSMRDIAEEAKMSLGGIYRYFDSKNAIIISYIEKSNQESAEAFEFLIKSKDFKKSLDSLLKILWKEFVDKNELSIYMEIFSEALRNEEVHRIIQKENTEEQFANILKQANKAKKINLQLPADMAAMIIMSVVEKAACNYKLHSSFKKRDAMRYIEEVLNLIIV